MASTETMSAKPEALLSDSTHLLRDVIDYVHQNAAAPPSLAVFRTGRSLDAHFAPATEEGRRACLPRPIAFHEDIPYDFEVSHYLPVVACYFSPHQHIRDAAAGMVQDCHSEKTAAFYFTGRARSDATFAFQEQMRRCLDEGYRLLVSSDCSAFLSRTKKRFGPDVRVVRGVHRDLSALLALIGAFSRSSKLYLATGCVSLWMLLYRGSKTGVCQWHPHLRVFYDLTQRTYVRSSTDVVTAAVAPSMAIGRWASYRLGDMFFSSAAQTQPDGRELHLRLFPDSLASEYMRRSKRPEEYTLMARLVRERQARLACIPDWAIHIRGGDVLEDEFGVARLCVTDEVEMGHVGAIFMRSVHDIVADVRPGPTDADLHVYLVTGGCLVQDAPKTLDLVSLIADRLRAHPKIARVTIRCFEHPDDDFVLLCSARRFVPSGGGFSELVSTLRNDHSTVVCRRSGRTRMASA